MFIDLSNPCAMGLINQAPTESRFIELLQLNTKWVKDTQLIAFSFPLSNYSHACNSIIFPSGSVR